MNFQGLERRLVAACVRHVSDNADDRTPLTHKEHIKVGRLFKLLNPLGRWRYFGQLYICESVDCVDVSSENHGMITIFIKLTKFLHSFS